MNKSAGRSISLAEQVEMARREVEGRTPSLRQATDLRQTDFFRSTSGDERQCQSGIAAAGISLNDNLSAIYGAFIRIRLLAGDAIADAHRRGDAPEARLLEILLEIREIADRMHNIPGQIISSIPCDTVIETSDIRSSKPCI